MAVGARRRRQRLSDYDLLMRAGREDDFLTAVMNLLATHSWWATHARAGLYEVKGNMATLVQGKPGSPDILAVRPPRVLLAECKREGYGDLRLDGKGYLTAVDVTPAEREWLVRLAQSPGVEVYLWTPGMIEQIAEVLA